MNITQMFQSNACYREEILLKPAHVHNGRDFVRKVNPRCKGALMACLSGKAHQNRSENPS